MPLLGMEWLNSLLGDGTDPMSSDNAYQQLFEPYDRGAVLTRQLGSGLQAFGQSLLKPNPRKGLTFPGAIANATQAFSESRSSAINDYMKEKRQKDIYNWVKSLPEKEQKLALADPERYAAMYMRRQQDEFEGTSGAGTYGYPVEYYDPETKQYMRLLTDKSGRQMRIPLGGSPVKTSQEVTTSEGTRLIPQGQVEGTTTVAGSSPTAIEFSKKLGDLEAIADQQQISFIRNAVDTFDTISGAKPLINEWTTGTKGVALANVPGTDAYELNRYIQQITGQSFRDNIQQMRGLGSLSDAEGRAVIQASNRISQGLDVNGLNKAIGDLEASLSRLLQAAQQDLQRRREKGPQTLTPIPAAPQTDTDPAGILGP